MWVIFAASGIFSLCILYTLVPFFKYFLSIWRVSRSLSRIPCPVEKLHWLLGSVPYLHGPTEKGLMQRIKFTGRYPYYYKLWFGILNPRIDVCHPEIVRQLYKSGAPKSLMRGSGYHFIKQWIGNGLILSNGQKWFRNRRLLTPAFHFDILKPYLKIFNHCTEELIHFLTKSRMKDGKSIDIYEKVSLCTLGIILKCAFSYDEELPSGDSQSPYVQAVMSMTHRIAKRVFNPVHHYDIAYYNTQDGRQFKKALDLAHQVARDVISRRKKTLDELGEEKMRAAKKYVDFLDILLMARDEEGNGLTKQEIQDEVETFMFAGHDTTKSAISFILYNLARHPEIFKAAQKEVDDLLEGRDSDEILWGDLSRIPYLTKCIKESMRLHPPVPSIGRALDKPVTINGHLFPKETSFIVNIWSIHHNPAIWGEDHMTFDPERFSEERVSQMDPYSYIPFSAGPRNCIGQIFALNEVKVTVVRFLKTFDISVDPTVNVELVPEAVLKAKHGIFLNFIPRN